MTSFDDYLKAVNALTAAIAEADRADAQAAKAANAAIEQFDNAQANRIAAVQASAAACAQEYTTATRLLKSGAGQQLGVQLPERVRPTSDVNIRPDEAMRAQTEAVRRLTLLLGEFEAAAKRDAKTAQDAAAALAARRAALKTSAPDPDPPAPAPAAQPEPLSPKQPRLGSLAGVPAMWVAIALPLEVLAAPSLGVAMGTAVNVGISFVAAFWLVGVRRITLDSLMQARRAAKTSRTKQPGKRKAVAGILERATEKGQLTGYEPEALKAVEIPAVPLMHGEPGVGLSNSGFDSGAVRAGQLGELNFAKALVKAGLIQRFATFWSIHMLSKDTYGHEQSDVDCAIITGRTIWLIDLKYYAGGNVVYRSADGNQLQCIDVPTGQQVGQSKKMSKNMQMAVDRFRSRYKNYSSFAIQARVVFVPTNSGVGRIDGVKWPGDIPAVMLPDFLTELQSEPPFVESLDSDLVRRTFQGLLKK